MKYLYIILTLLIATACSHNPSEPPDRPGNNTGGNDPQNPTDNWLPEQLADPSPRFVTNDVTILYKSGGVIFGKNSTGGFYIYDNTSKNRIDFNPATESLYINNIKQPISKISLEKNVDETSWYVIEIADSESSRVIFVTDL